MSKKEKNNNVFVIHYEASLNFNTETRDIQGSKHCCGESVSEKSYNETIKNVIKEVESSLKNKYKTFEKESYECSELDNVYTKITWKVGNQVLAEGTIFKEFLFTVSL